MKRLLLTTLPIWLWTAFAAAPLAWAQTRPDQATSVADTIPIYSDALARQQASLAKEHRPWVGIDLARGVWWLYSAINTAQTPVYYRPVSAIIYLPVERRWRADKSAYISVGYATYAGMLQRNIYQRGNSVHLRSGIEIKRHNLLLGYGAVLARWSGDGSLLFKGPTFGDYQQAIGTLSGLALGGEGYLGGEVPLSHKLAARLLVRSTLLVKTDNQLHIPPPYLSGLDLFGTDKVAGLGISGQLWLVYRLN